MNEDGVHNEAEDQNETQVNLKEKGKAKATESDGSKRKRKQGCVPDTSGSESDGSTSSGGDSDPTYQGETIEQSEWSLDEDLGSYKSEDLHSPVSSDDEANNYNKTQFPQFDEVAGFGKVRLELGMEFGDLQSFKEAVKDYTIDVGREMRWIKNDSIRATAECRVENCPWRIYCAWSKARLSFQIKSFNEEHTCSRTFRNRAASTSWCTKKLEKKLRVQPNLTHTEAYDYMKRKYGVLLNETKIFKSLKKARKLVEGNEAEQYAKLWDYAHELMKSNPGSTVKMDTVAVSEEERQFQRIYICLDACKRGFKAGCRPLIGLDGCFLKGYYGGQLLSAVGQDANNQLYVIAYAIVNVENKDNWKWFLELLHGDLGDYKQHGWTFISDMQKVIHFLFLMLAVLL